MTEMAVVNNSERTYLPAAGRDLFLPFYDVVTKVLGADKARRALLNHTHLRPGDRVLDIGCGTGTLAIELKQDFPGVEVVGLDPDPRALGRAKRKAQRVGINRGVPSGIRGYAALSFQQF
jgi:ubiquinone/menaquinone biosynthesis C-methylase UbiE